MNIFVKNSFILDLSDVRCHFNWSERGSKINNSLYAHWAEDLNKLGYDCSGLTDDEMNQVGRAAERAVLDWDWATADWEGDERRARRIGEAKDAVHCTNCSTEDEMIGNSVGATLDEIMRYR